MMPNSQPLLSVLIATHNPDLARLNAVMDALGRQTLDMDLWEIIIVDNGSAIPVKYEDAWELRGKAVAIVSEPRLGLMYARRAGIRASTAPLIVFCDDDNVLDPKYLEIVVNVFEENPHLGNLCGKIIGLFESSVEPWVHEFGDLLALRDYGDRRIFRADLSKGYPAFAFGGGGAAFRRDALLAALARLDSLAGAPVLGRTGKSLASGEDNDIVLALVASGWAVGFEPSLMLHHIIPHHRTRKAYLGRLNREIARSWIGVLDRHGIRPWSAVSSWTVPLRKLKAFISYRAWASHTGYIRWRGACGHFEGRARLD